MNVEQSSTSKIIAIIAILFAATLALATPHIGRAQSSSYDQVSASCKTFFPLDNFISRIRQSAALTRTAVSGPLPPQCTAADKRNLKAAVVELNQSEVINPIRVYADPNSTEEQKAAVKSKIDKIPGVTGSCGIVGFNATECLWNPLAIWLGSWFVTVGGSILRLAGMVFDALMGFVILDFKGTLDSLGILSLITAGWTFFRDLSNILIIGIFVFIAISLILGLTQFGQKKLIANVLIIAILMNFSLLFTKLIIDTSNFLAFTIYKQTAGAANASGQPASISDKFLSPMKITSVWDSTGALKEVSKQPSGGPLKTFIFGFFGGIILLLIGIVLFYGAILLAARAVLFILLMLTAPLAFFAFLVPTLEKSEYGWSGWWKSLLNNAIFAPILMVMLSISILIVSQASKGTGSATLGQIISDPSKQVLADGWSVLIVYVLGVGLLYASLRMSSNLAGSVSGFSLGSALSSTAFGAASRLAGGAGRNIFGRGALAKAQVAEHKAEQEAKRQAAHPETQNLAKLSKLLLKKDKLEAKAKRTYDFTNTGLGQSLAKGGLFAGKTTKGYEPGDKERATEAAKAAVGLAMTREEAAKVAREESGTQRASLQEERDTNAAVVKAANESAEAAKAAQGLIQKQSEATGTKRDAEWKKASLATQHAVAEKNIQAEIASARDAAARDRATERLAQSRAEHQQAIQQQDARIEGAHTVLQDVANKKDLIDKFFNTPAVQEAAEKQAAAKAKLGQLDSQVVNRSKEIHEASQRIGEGVAADLTRNPFTRALNRIVKIESGTANMARELFRKKIKAKPLVEKLKAEKEAKDDIGGTTGSSETH